MCACHEENLCIKFDEIEAAERNLPLPSICTNNDEGFSYSDSTGSKVLTVSPNFLRFPYNDPKNHVQKINFWNRTQNSLKIRLKSSKPSVFLIEDSLRKGGWPEFRPTRHIINYGLAATTVSIRCTPGNYKMAKFFLQVLVYRGQNSRDACECFQIPLEIYPSTMWCKLPKTIVLPDVTIGRKAHALITLPQPAVSERYFVTFSPNFTKNAITMYPMHGIIGGEDGIKQLRITYAPTEFTTISCSIAVHFPGVSENTTHEIKILARCRPGNEIDAIRKEITEIERFLPMKPIKKKRTPKLEFKLSKGKVNLRPPTENIKKPLSLFTNAGVQHFLLSKEDELIKYRETELNHGTRTEIEKLAETVELDDAEKYKIYMDIKKRLGLDFEDEDEYDTSHYHREGHRSLGNIHHHGSVHDTSHPHARLKLTKAQRLHWEEFENTVGFALLGRIKELPKYLEEQDSQSSHHHAHFHHDIYHDHDHHHHDHHHHHHRHSRKTRRMTRSAPSLHARHRKSAYKMEDPNSDAMSYEDDVRLDLTPKQKFIQIVLRVITRERVIKRLQKIRQLVGQDVQRVLPRKSSSSKRKSLKSRTNSTTSKGDDDFVKERKPSKSSHRKSQR